MNDDNLSSVHQSSSDANDGYVAIRTDHMPYIKNKKKAKPFVGFSFYYSKFLIIN